MTQHEQISDRITFIDETTKRIPLARTIMETLQRHKLIACDHTGLIRDPDELKREIWLLDNSRAEAVPETIIKQLILGPLIRRPFIGELTIDDDILTEDTSQKWHLRVYGRENKEIALRIAQTLMDNFPKHITVLLVDEKQKYSHNRKLFHRY